MNFFDYIKNDSFFKPLTSKYRRIYYDCIQLLIDRAKELPVLYETDARDSITLYLKNADIRREASETEDQEGELQASEILALFRECGWVLPREIGRNGEYVTNIATDCRKVMDFLRKMAERSGQGMMSNRIFSMYEIMKSAFDEDSVRRERPYSNILIPMLDNETELKNELADLKDSISTIMKAVIVFQDINSFGQFIMKDEMLDRFFNEYFFIKNNGLIPAQLSYIKSGLRRLKSGELREKMAFECSEKLELTVDEAEERMEQHFAELDYFLKVEYEDNMELIDARINNYYNLANTRIMLMASNGMRLEAVLNDFLNALKDLDGTQQEAVLERVSDCVRITSQKYVGYKSFEKRQKLKNEGMNIGLVNDELSEEEKRLQTEKLFCGAANRYSVERVSDFLSVTLGNDRQFSLKEKKIRTREEALMYAAAMLYAKNEEFPYQIALTQDVIKTDVADMSNLVISRK